MIDFEDFISFWKEFYDELTDEENYEYLEDKNVTSYIKYNNFESEHADKWKKDPSKSDNLHYNQDKDCFYCPMGQAMSFVSERKVTNDNGYQQTIRKYQAQRCRQCPMRGPCHKSKGNRTIEVNIKARKYREAARERLNSE